MIRWYDWIVAWYTANLVYGVFFIPYIGWILSAIALESWVIIYCTFRYNQEKND